MIFEGAFPTPVTMALSPSLSNPPPHPRLEPVDLLLMCLWKQEIHKLMICIFYFALFLFYLVI